MGTKARILLVDGYNVINRVPELRPSLDGGLQNARNRLALQVSTWGHEHSGIECVIVFDGDFEHSGGRGQRLAGIRCVYSLTAHGGDDEIIRLAREHKARGADVTVVSDDNKVGNNCRAHGASVRPAGYIMSGKGRERPGGARSATKSSGKGGRGGGGGAGGGKDGSGGVNGVSGVGPGKAIDRKAAAEIDQELKKKYGLD